MRNRPRSSNCIPEPFLINCDIQGQKATIHCAFFSSIATLVTSLFLHLLLLLYVLQLLCWTLCLFLCFTRSRQKHTPSISPWVISSTASCRGLTHTPDLTFHWHLSVFASVDLGWVKIIQLLRHIEPRWRALFSQMEPVRAEVSRHRFQKSTDISLTGMEY